MKKHLLVAAGIALFAASCNTKNPHEVTISGTITNPINNSVEFFNKDTSFTTKTNENGSFSLTFAIDSASYFNFQHGPESTVMFIEPGNTINLSINPEEFDETITYTGSPASSFLAKSYLLKEQMDFEGELFYTGTAEAYAAMINEYKTSVLNELIKVKDTTFINYQTNKLNKTTASYLKNQSELASLASEKRVFLYENSKISEIQFYYAVDTLEAEAFNELLSNYANTLYALLKNIDDEKFVSDKKEKIDAVVQRWSERKTMVDNVPAVGEPAKDFTYPDIEGNDVSLASLKGKLVYVDVWATWCGPCKAEIPALKALEAEYHDKNIQFLSVSVDTDKEAWETMVANKELGGVQLWADGWSEITKDYAIFGIPRFMLFDAEGKVISTDAVRPSSDEIRDLLNSHL